MLDTVTVVIIKFGAVTAIDHLIVIAIEFIIGIVVITMFGMLVVEA